MPELQPRVFPHLEHCDALSQHLLESHVRLYQGYVKKYNELRGRLDELQQRGPSATLDSSSLKGDLTFALGAMKNHELYFETLGTGGGASEPGGDLAGMIVRSFHSLPLYLVDLKQTALQARGWAWTAYDLDHQSLFNYPEGDHNGLPVWNAVPLLAIDLYGHAYFYDFGNHKAAYVETVMGAIDWEKVAGRLAALRQGV